MSESRDELPDEELPIYCPLAEMAIFIASRVQPQGEPFRATNDKVHKRLKYATKIGRLHTLGPNLCHVPRTMAWAQEKWPGKFEDLFAELSDTATATAVMSDELVGWVIPGDLPTCQKALDETHQENQRLRTELKELRAEIVRLKPSAQRYKRNCATNAHSAKGKRKGKL